jgi:A/G-specific adenine glycosylase
VYEYWAGLGYYSRACNLHKAAQHISKNGFPKSYKDFMELPGFGPYTSRAVSSLAFSESVGVLDGNVIRFLCRYHNLKTAWWKPKNRQRLQDLADQWVKKVDSSILNQALMEIGATICTPQSPSCMICPLQKSCQAFKLQTVDRLPLKRPRKKKEILFWQAVVLIRQKKVAYTVNNYAPFLPGKLIFPGTVKVLRVPPKVYDYKHSITHHEIYVKLKHSTTIQRGLKLSWYDNNEIKKIHPVSLLQKALLILQKKDKQKNYSS